MQRTRFIKPGRTRFPPRSEQQETDRLLRLKKKREKEEKERWLLTQNRPKARTYGVSTDRSDPNTLVAKKLSFARTFNEPIPPTKLTLSVQKVFMDGQYPRLQVLDKLWQTERRQGIDKVFKQLHCQTPTSQTWLVWSGPWAMWVELVKMSNEWFLRHSFAYTDGPKGAKRNWQLRGGRIIWKRTIRFSDFANTSSAGIPHPSG